MRKKWFGISVLVLALLMLAASSGYCVPNNWGGTDRRQLLGKVMPSYIQAAGTAFGGSTSMATSDESVPLGYSVVYKAIASDTLDPLGSIAGTLADGTPGQILKIIISVVGTVGDTTGSWILTPTTKTGFTTLTFDATKDEVTLLYVDDTTGWMLISSTSVTVGQPFTGW